MPAGHARVSVLMQDLCLPDASSTHINLDRRVQCDGGSPACQKCIQGRRHCQGYGLRLSWPRQNDKKRAFTHAASSTVASQNLKTDISFINTTWSDLELFHHLNSRLNALASPAKLWKHQHPQLNASSMELLTYCTLPQTRLNKYTC